MRLNRKKRVALGVTLLAGTMLSAAGSSWAADVTFERLLNPEPANWLTHNRTYDSNRYSPLDQINRETVGNLDFAFSLALIPRLVAGLGGGLQGTPLVNDGTMYFTDGAGALYSIDVSSGTRAYINWIMDPDTDPETAGIVNNRGAALLGNSVFTLTRDGYLTATDAGTGEILWDIGTQANPAEYFTMAPLALEDRIIMGPAGDAPVRGRMEARSAEDGTLLWTFHTIPGPGEFGHETWPDNDVWMTGASGLWTTGSFDPDTNLIFWGTANPTPFGDPTLRPGDNLFSSALLAINADDGSLAWYFQYTPNEQWDYDEIGTHQLIAAGDGQTRVQHFGRNGFNYVFDAADGTFVNAVQYVNEVTWTAGIDTKTGMPVEYDPALAVGGIQTYAHGAFAGDTQVDRFCPNLQGGVNHQPTSYSPRTGLVYGSSLEACSITEGGFGISPRATGAIVASNADGDIAAKAEIPFMPYGGNLSTAGGLVFSSMVNGDFFAMNDETLEILWNVNLGAVIEAPPITYAVDGQQFIVIPVGTSGINNLFSGGGYPTRGDDPNAALLANMQRTWTLYFFAL